MVYLITGEVIGTLYLDPMMAATGVVLFVPGEPGGSLGVVDGEGNLLPDSMIMSSKEE